MVMQVPQRADYTFKYNQQLGRHGWLRLTPAYSVKLVQKIIAQIPEQAFILDPFSGTATTGLVAAEHDIPAHCFDINPFLVWFGNAKCRNYSPAELKTLQDRINEALIACQTGIKQDNWVPDIHNIERWWSHSTLKILAALRQALVDQFGEPQSDTVGSLAWIAFCRLIIETSSAAFNHVSMSFHDEAIAYEFDHIHKLFLEIVAMIVRTADQEIVTSAVIYHADSRNPAPIDGTRYSHVITSPPYPNRISYIRELRPYMYWTKFLQTSREAGEIDWQAIGGTWGVATSRLKDWHANGLTLPKSLDSVVDQILATEEKHNLLMANYVWKYFYDMFLHFQNLRQTLQSGAKLIYIIGNSSFYGVEVHTEKLFEAILQSSGFSNIGSSIIRKRNSKKELFEYCVYATWQENSSYTPAFLTKNRGKQLTLFEGV